MANIEMNVLKVGNSEFEIADAQARQDVSDLKDDFYDSLVTDTASGAIASFSDGADNVPVKSLTVAIEPTQAGTGDPSPTNIRPISGHTQAVVTRTGVNIFGGEAFADTIMEKVPNATIDRDAKTVTYSAVNVSSKVLFENFKPNTRYTMFYTCEGVTNLAIEYTDGIYGYTTASGIYVSNAGKSIKCLIGIWSSGTTVMRYDLFGILEGVLTSSDFEPYNGQTVTIDLDGTRYGGTLNATTGVLTVDRYMCDLSNTYPYSVSSQTDSVAVASLYLLDPAVALPSSKPGTLISNRFSSNIESGIPGRCVLVDDHIYFVISKSELTSVDYIGIREWISNHPTQMCYELATPQTIQLTAQEVRTLLGTNNIWSDAGNVDVTYRADTKLYIEKLTAPTEDDMVADHAISANSFFMVGNTLYRATTAIASGATITVGTNATKMSLSEALNALA